MEAIFERVNANFNQGTSGDGRSLPAITNRWSTLVMRCDRKMSQEKDD
jgi:hypothetical protein